MELTARFSFGGRNRSGNTSLINVRLSSHDPPSSIPSNNEVCFVELPSTQDSPIEMAGQRYEEAIQACDACPSISIRCVGISIDFNDGVDEKNFPWY